jgi:hypothetical protein
MSDNATANKRTLFERLEWPQGESLHALLKDARSVLTDMPDDLLRPVALAYSALRIEHIGNPSSYYVYDEREVFDDNDDGIIGVFSTIEGANRLLVKRVLMEAQAVWRMKR